MVSSFAIHYGNEKTLDGAAAHPPRRAAAGRCDPALRPGPGRHALGAARRRRAAARDLDRPQHGLPGPEGLKTGAGAALLKDPDRAVAVARAAREGSGLPVTVKLRAG